MYDALIKSVEDNKLTNTHAVLSFIHVFSRRFEKKKKTRDKFINPNQSRYIEGLYVRINTT